MELFLDEKYIKDSEKKIDYSNLVEITNYPAGISAIGNITAKYKSGDILIITANPANIDDCHIKNDNILCYSVKIAPNMKKIIL